jgi:hypothetical protein
VLAAAGRVLGVDGDAVDARRFADVVAFQLRYQRAEPAVQGNHDDHGALGTEMEDSGEVGHSNGMEQHKAVELASFQLSADASHARVVLGLANMPGENGGFRRS